MGDCQINVEIGQAILTILKDSTYKLCLGIPVSFKGKTTSNIPVETITGQSKRDYLASS
jgi:hypothetical protein